MSAQDIGIAVPGRDRLGESPVWDAQSGTLHWVDIRAGVVRSWQAVGGALSERRLADLAGFVALANEPGRLLVGTRRSIGWIALGEPGMDTLVEIEPDLPENRLNEARVDPHGALVFGTMCDADRRPSGGLYRLGADGVLARMLSGITVPNSLAWSPDGKTLYFADTWRHCIWRFGYGGDGLAPASRDVFVDLSATAGRPDGAAVDVAGGLWSAQPGTGRITRYHPDGTVDRIVQLPARDVTALCFGGDDLRTLYVTSATQKLNDAELLAAPLSGSVFSIRCAFAGLPASRFGC